MSHYNHENWGDIANTIFAKGVITAVDSDDDTADVTVEGYQDGSAIPLFYHCEPDSEEASNGSIEGAAGGFSVDDEVIVMCTAAGAPVRIVGFVDGIKTCIWEPWDDSDTPDLCKNHTWYLTNVWTDIEGCSITLPWHHVDTRPSAICKGIMDVAITNGVLSWTGTHTNCNSASAIYWWPEEAGDWWVSGITKLKIKFTAAVSGGASAEHPGNFMTLVISSVVYPAGLEIVLANNGAALPWWITNQPYGFPDLNGGGDAEIEVDLTQYGFTSPAEIDDVSLFWYSDYDYEYGGTDTRTMAFTCDYINFK